MGGYRWVALSIAFHPVYSCTHTRALSVFLCVSIHAIAGRQGPVRPSLWSLCALILSHGHGERRGTVYVCICVCDRGSDAVADILCATTSQQALYLAKRLFALMDGKCHDGTFHGYHEAPLNDWCVRTCVCYTHVYIHTLLINHIHGRECVCVHHCIYTHIPSINLCTYVNTHACLFFLMQVVRPGAVPGYDCEAHAQDYQHPPAPAR